MRNLNLILFGLLLTINVVAQDYTDEQQKKLDEYFATWSYDSLATEGTNYVIIAAAYKDQGINENEVKQRLEYAVLIFNETIKRKKDDSYCYFWRGMAKRLQGNFTSALTDFSTASKFEPENFKHYEQKADCKQKLEDFYGAIQDYTTALNKTSQTDYSEYHRLYADRSYCYLMQGKNEQALQDCDKAISLKDDISRYYLLRGMAKLGLNKIKDACLDFSKAGELGNTQVFEIIKEYCNE